MLCKICRAVMTRRMGEHGPFLFCPNQYNGCAQKTVTVTGRTKTDPVIHHTFSGGSITRITKRPSNVFNPITCSTEPLMAEAQLLEKDIPELFRTDPNDPPFVDGNGDIDWAYEDEADWWRPY